MFIEIIELLFTAGTLAPLQKLPILMKASGKLDLLKFFLHIAWDMHILDTKKFTKLSEDLVQIGNMLGGWIRSLQK